MKQLRTSAAYRIAFAYSAAIAIGIALLGTILFWSMHAAFTRQIEAMIQGEMDTLMLEYRDDGPSELSTAIEQRERLSPNVRLYYAVFDPDGRRVLGSLQTRRPPLGMHDVVFFDPNEGPDTAQALAADLSDGRRLVVAADREWVEQIDRTVLATFATGFVAILVLGLIAALLLGGYLRFRLQSIGDTARAIIGGDIRRRMPIGARHDEFDQLAIVLNSMLEEIERLLENLRQVSSDVAHDLRTPLTQLRNALERSLQGDQNAESLKEVVVDGLTRVDQILSLFSAILRISEVEGGKIRRRFVAVDVSELVTDLAESYAPALREGGCELSWDVEPDLSLAGDRELIAQAVINLIENAQLHTPEGSKVRISASDGGTRVAIVVADNGPGVAEGDRDLISRRFVRLDSSRSLAGHGLGLNLVAAVARLHGGELRFADNRPGLVAMLDLPKGSA